MKSIAEIIERIEKIQSDSRFQAPSAQVQINAPLALIQMHLEAVFTTLHWVLKEGDSPDLLSICEEMLGILNNIDYNEVCGMSYEDIPFAKFEAAIKSAKLDRDKLIDFQVFSDMDKESSES